MLIGDFMADLAPRLYNLFSAPFKALYSRNFYLQVLFAKRGVGFTYLMFLSLLLAFPVTYKVLNVVDLLKNFELSRLVAQVPPSYISPSGLLTSKSEINYAEITNSKGEVIIVYNPEDQILTGNLLNAPIEITSSSLIIRLNNEDGSTHSAQAIPWTLIFEKGGNFEPMQVAAAFEEAASAPMLGFYVGAIVYLLFYVVLNWFIIAAFGRLLMYFISKVKIRFKDALRLSSYANTLVMIIGALSFYYTIDFTIIFLLPIFYIIMVGRFIRQKVMAVGAEAFGLAIEIALKRDNLKNGVSDQDFNFALEQIRNKNNNQDSASESSNKSQDFHNGSFMA